MDELIIADIQSSCNSEGQCVGHWISLARQYIELFSDSYIVKVAGGPVYNRSISPDNVSSLPFNVNESDSHFKILCKFIANAYYLFKNSHGSRIILQYGSPFSNHIAACVTYRKSKLFLIEYSTVGIDTWLKKLVFTLLKPHISGVICPSDKIGKAFKVPYCVVPDYIYTEKRNNITKRYDEKKYDFCMVGRISPEKGIVESAKKLAGSKYNVVIAGIPENDSLKSELIKVCANVSNIELKIGFLSDNEFEKIIQNSKYSILNYHGVYAERSSGVVYDTIFRGVPVIGKRCMALKFIDDYNLGYLYNNIEEVNFDSFFDRNLYEKYEENIVKYRMIHKEYEIKLKNFLNNHG